MTHASSTPPLAGFTRMTLSIVSHGQGELIRPLLEDLRPAVAAGARLVITLNIPEEESFLGGLGEDAQILRNERPLGFGANHNQAFKSIQDTDRFVILNPDIRCDASVFAPLLDAANGGDAGAVAPRVLSAEGMVEDSARRHPSMRRILQRVLMRARGKRTQPDYTLEGDRSISVEWVAGMFIMFPRAVYAEVGGFDERYFMYLEDADICRRIALTGRKTLLLPYVDVVHDARRATSNSATHLRWHIGSLMRYLWRFRS
jgi:N-acetylglucosaminyl-diphospho-decaprenol L-rhamnosyltransferase